MNGLWPQMRQAFRQMTRRSVVTATAVLTFALGIGANVAIFVMAWPVLMAPLPFADEARLTQVSLTYVRDDVTLQNPVSSSDYLDMRTASSFAEMAAYSRSTRQFNLTGRGETQQVTVGAVTPEFFSLLGVTPLAGRLMNPDDGREGRVIVLNEKIWRSRFGSDPAIVGTMLDFDGVTYEVIGVVPLATGLGTVDADGWTAQWIQPGGARQRAYYLGVVGRLTPGVSLDTANAELASVMARVASEYPESNGNLSARARQFREEVTSGLRPTLILLLISAGLVLVVAGINLTSLQLAREVERARELGVRSALGASRWHLVRQALVESMAVSCVGGVVGLVVAFSVLSMLQSIAPSVGWNEHVPVSRAQMLLFGGVLTVVAGLLQTLVPALRLARYSVSHDVLKSRAVSAGSAHVRGRVAVVAAQVAVTAVLLVVAGLVAASQRNAIALDPGFHVDSTLAADLYVPPGVFGNPAQVTQFLETLVDRIEALPGVHRACMAHEVPLDRTPGNMTFVPEGPDGPLTMEARVRAMPNSITRGCAEVLGLQMLQGRQVTGGEPETSIMVSASMAKALFPNGQDPVEQRVRLGLPTGPALTIVGVVADIRDSSLEEDPGRQVWFDASVGYYPAKRLLVRYDNASLMDGRAVSRVLQELAPNLALANVRPLSIVLANATGSRRLALLLLGGFALVAVVLCGVGIYGTLAHAIGQRTREIGIRLALGAQPASVVRLVVWQMGLAVGVGLMAGVWAARALSATITSLLYGVAATDLRVYLGVVAAVVGFALIAAWSPTRWAMRIDPRTAMDAEG